MKMVWLFHLVFLSSLALTACIVAFSGEQNIEFLNLCETSEDIVTASSNSEFPLAVSLNNEDLNEVSTNILLAEKWLRSNIFPYYPSSKITNIIGKTSTFCHQQDQNKNNNLNVVLSALKNLYHSLTRWGLEKDIKVSIAFDLICFNQNPDFKLVKPMIEFLQTVNSTFSIITNSDKNVNFITSHLESMKKIGFFNLNNIINVATNIVPKERTKTLNRKLYVIPVKPTPFPEIAEPPLNFPIGSPSNQPNSKPLPPLAQIVSSPPPISSPNFAPQEQQQPSPLPPQFLTPANSPQYGFNLPPCNPIQHGSPSISPYPQNVPVQKLWCVAKPSVPEETLQQALDYACGEGAADCLEITTPQGNCYYPDTLVAHASYAFNSYWQKHKRNGGTCNFGGTAMLINSDPSFLHCRFILI
ncbi:glucan endo-1,3-beta-glucosidase 12 [Trifolium pratense]|nr:glucan endo-1,3-beta-glucosidase 12 [Trifolium pratense]